MGRSVSADAELRPEAAPIPPRRRRLDAGFQIRDAPGSPAVHQPSEDVTQEVHPSANCASDASDDALERPQLPEGHPHCKERRPADADQSQATRLDGSAGRSAGRAESRPTLQVIRQPEHLPLDCWELRPTEQAQNKPDAVQSAA